MIITARLNGYMREFVATYAGPTLAPVFEHDVTPVTETLFDVVAPFTAWQVLVDEISERMAVKGARVNSHRSRQILRLTSRVAKPMSKMLMHPALAGRGKVGEHWNDGAFPVWSQPRDRWGRVWCPHPTGGEFELLKPALSDLKGIPVTVWTHLGMAPQHWTYDPALHVAIWTRSALPALGRSAPPPSAPSCG